MPLCSADLYRRLKKVFHTSEPHPKHPNGGAEHPNGGAEHPNGGAELRARGVAGRQGRGEALADSARNEGGIRRPAAPDPAASGDPADPAALQDPGRDSGQDEWPINYLDTRAVACSNNFGASRQSRDPIT